MIRPSATALMFSAVLAACGPAAQNTSDTGAETPETLVEPTQTGAAETPETTEQETAPAAPVETIGYPEGWEMQNYWSGEYPNAFAVTQEGVTVLGHETITYQEHPPIYCGLPAKATYSPWNFARAESDDLHFVAMTYPTTFTIQEDTTIEVFQDEGASELSLSAGDVLTYKSYLAEGFFIAEKDGVLYELNEAALPESTDFEQGPEDQEWVRVTCDDAAKTRAWILYEQALQAPGVEPYEYTGFGEASDLP